MSFKGSMANYYHEARAHQRKLKEIQEENKRRADRRAEVLAPHAEDPLQTLVIAGQSCKVHRNSELHAANENGDGLIPWNGQQDNLIDRFDGRALLDFYRDPPAHRMDPPKGHDEMKLEEMLRFEAYRDLVRLLVKGLPDARGLDLVEQEVLARRAQQHAAQQAADEMALGQRPGGSGAGAGGAAASSMPLPMAAYGAGTGAYSAVGFSYGADGAAGEGDDPFSSEGDSSSDEDDSSGEEEGAPATEAEAAEEAEDERVDELAEAYGLRDFSYRLHKVQEQEGEQELARHKPPRRGMGRKKAAARARRMAGQGLDPLTGLPKALMADPYKDTQRLVNPWAEPSSGRGEGQERRGGGGGGVDFWDLPVRRSSPVYDGGRGRSKSRSCSPGREVTHFITEFRGGGGGDDPGRSTAAAAGAGGLNRGGILEALPDRPDPAMLGGIQPVARELMTVQGIRRAARSPSPAQDHSRRRSSSRDRDRDRDRGRGRASPQRRSGTPPWRQGRRSSRSRSRSRSKGGSRSPAHRQGNREATPPWRKGRSRSRSGGRHRDSSPGRRKGSSSSHRSSRRSRSRDRQRSRSRSRDRDRPRERRSSDGHRQRSRRSPSRSRSRSRGRSPGQGSGYKAAAASGSRPLPGSAGTAGRVSAGLAGNAAASAPAKQESAQERLRRLMKAQLDNAFQKDSLAATQKKMQEEKDKVARMQVQRATTSLPERYSSVERSRDRR